jgi:pachytene checkpoint protein 2
VLFVTTTNFPDAVDEAFLSRSDLVLRLDLPDVDTIAAILAHALRELAAIWPGVLPLTRDEGMHAKLAARCEGWDGRRVRKLVLAALAQRREVARDPGKLTADDLLAAVEDSR